ncbi:hypothetical protein F4827_006315 [Paraburkholderia bannensis]|uniref:Uncharacterized protein n=2 Tax=Paraburkholderia TaxID=1822464 RepID=A0A7W9WUI4_9BURK|nr:hypothetical protein [Paraburkholderia bannensis]MBB3261257.1 hypothetical protein [Paraburkholderia sp. WP4_3_2]MBB6106440.1 hypothetical protein [Paraburkholderia bannensis]
MQLENKLPDLPAGLVVFSSDGSAQFGWQNPETGAFYAEVDGQCIINAIGCVPWHADTVH